MFPNSFLSIIFIFTLSISNSWSQQLLETSEITGFAFYEYEDNEIINSTNGNRFNPGTEENLLFQLFQSRSNEDVQSLYAEGYITNVLPIASFEAMEKIESKKLKLLHKVKFQLWEEEFKIVQFEIYFNDEYVKTKAMIAKKKNQRFLAYDMMNKDFVFSFFSKLRTQPLKELFKITSQSADTQIGILDPVVFDPDGRLNLTFLRYSDPYLKKDKKLFEWLFGDHYSNPNKYSAWWEKYY